MDFQRIMIEMNPDDSNRFKDLEMMVKLKFKVTER